MKWRNKRPTKVGWWWVRHPYYGTFPVRVYLYVSQGYEHKKGESFLMVAEPGPARSLKDKYFNGCQWAGPMKTPEGER